MREARGPEWTDWLREHGIVALTGIDTRSLVLHLRDAGSAPAIAVASDLAGRGGDRARGAAAVDARARARRGRLDATSRTSSRRRAASRIGVVDYGVKNSVLRRLAKAGAAVTVHPHDIDADELAGYDGVLLSPGPGDPEPLEAETETVRQLLGRTQVLGICLGHQLIARATGHETYKLPFGHRGANHPVHERLTRPRARDEPEPRLRGRGRARRPRCRTSRSTTARSRGSTCPELRARSLQFHPEAGPGPHDAWPLLEAWVEEVADAAAHRHRVDLHRRLRPDRDRPGGRVRLRGLPGAQGAARGRVPHDRRQLEPGDDHDRPRLRRPHVSRAARRRVGGRGAAPRAARRAPADDGRPDGAQPRARARATRASSTSSGSS